MGNTPHSEAQPLLQVFERRRADGTHYYRDEEIRDFLPVFLIGARVDVGSSPQLIEVMKDFLGRVGHRPEMTTKETQAAIDGYLRAHPVNPELLAEVQRIISSGGAAVSAAALAGDVANLLGTKRTVIPSAVGAPRPEGTARGPLVALSNPPKR